jgi:hypothetical protein
LPLTQLSAFIALHATQVPASAPQKPVLAT